MEQKFIAAWEQSRAAASLMGIRMRALDVKGAKRVLAGVASVTVSMNWLRRVH